MLHTKTHRTARLHGVLLAGALALSTGANAQLADLALRQEYPPTGAHPHDGGMGDLDELLHKYDERIEFIENKGQFNAAVRFKADFPLGQALATPEGMLMKAYDPAAVKARQEEGMRIEQEQHDGKPWRPLIWQERGHGWMMKFQNALPTMRVESRDAHPEVNNYFLGGKEALNVHSFQEVWYTGVYRGIDVRYYPAADGSLEYDVVCGPYSDPKAIAIEFKGISGMRVSEKGELVMPTSLGDLTYPAPVVYQRIGGRERKVEAQYTVHNGNVLGFALGAYDRSQPLVIDPIAMRWATWVNTNSSDDNHGHAIWVDPSDGAIYMVARVVGTTDNITIGAFDVTANGALETIVGKYLEPANIGGAGTRVWQTYIGGNGDDNPYAMEQGVDGNLYITGQTSSTDFPLLGGSAFAGQSINQQAQSGIDVFVLKITQDGQSIKAAVVGGNGADDNYDVRTAPNGDVFVCGSTTSTNLLTLNAGSGASNTNNGGSDVLLFRINQDLSSLVWMRNYGGSSADRASIMLHDPVSGDLFIGGNTSSSNFPTVSPRQATRGGTSAGFLQRLNGNTAATTWSSYFSSSTNNDANLLCMEFNTTRTELYFGGVTEGLNSANITAGAYDTGHNGNNDLYVGRMTISDQTLLGGTYVGGSGNEVNMMGLNVDLNNDVYVFGYTNSTNFPVSAAPNVPLQTTNQGENDKVFFKLESDLSALEFSTYYGGTTDDYDPVGERGIKFSNCRIYTIVTAESNNVPLTQGALNTTKLSSSSAIYEPGLVVWANPPDLLGNSITYTGTAICAGSIPGDIQGSQPSYVLPTILRNNTPSAYPSFGSAATFQWQISTDSVNWTNIAGATGQNLLGTQIGAVNQKTFIRRIIGGDACILAGAADQVVTVRIMSVVGQVSDASCNGGNNGSITATADGTPGFTYLWSDGQTTQTATGLAAGSYSVTVTDANGCTASNTFNVGQPTAVSGNINTTDATCGQSNGSASVSGTGGTPGYSYLWSTGAVGPNVNNVQAGAYTVTVTDANQCAVILPVNIGGTGVPDANAGNDATITCANNGQVVLSGTSQSGGVSFSWSGPGIVSGGSGQNATVNAPGIYTLTVTDPQTGCSATDQAEVGLDNTVPGAQATGGTLTCTTLSVQLTGAGNGSFSWIGPNGFASNDQNPVVSEAGTYVLTVTGTNGCTSTANAEVELDNTVPGAQATGGTLTCTTLSVQLTGAGNGSFSWIGPNGFTSNAQNPVVSEAGTYVLTVTGANGCTSTANAEVGLDNTVPGAQATGGTLTCTTLSVQLTGAGNGSYSWSGPNGFASNAQNPVVSEAGTYVLTVTGTNGCTSTAEALVELDVTLPGAQATGGTLTCTTLSVQLTGAGNGSYSWSGPNGYTSNAQNPVVSAAGTYVLTVTGANGCTSTATAQVTDDTDAPEASAQGGAINCNILSTQLQGSGTGDLSWSGPGGFSSTEASPVVNIAGTYILTVTGGNGCTNTADAQVIINGTTASAAATGGELSCLQPEVQLLGASLTPGVNYAWSGPGGFTSTQQNPMVSVAGTYVLTVTGAPIQTADGPQACIGTAEAVVIGNTDLPGAQATGGTLTCTTLSVQLTGAGNGSYSWNGPNGFASNDQNPVVSEAGTYVLTVTGTNGCTSTANAEVELDNTVPGAQATGGTLTCTTLSVQLAGAGNGTYSWSGPNGFTSNDQNPVVNEAGTYVLTVTGANGCTSTANAEVGLDNTVPGAQATGGTLTCTTLSVQLAGAGNGTYSWSGPNGFASNDQNPVVTEAGTYVLTVTGANGCTSTANAVVDRDDTAPGAQAVGGVLSCSVSSVQLQGSGNGSFSWTGPNGFTSNDQSPVVGLAGVYVLTVTGTNGCTSTAQAEVSQDDEVPGAQATGGTLTCTTLSAQLTGAGNGSYSWSGPNGYTSNDQNPVVSEAGTYVLTVTGANGCTSTAQAEVELDNATPGATAQGGVLNCLNAELGVQLNGGSPSANVSFSWSGPGGFSSTDEDPTVNAAGTYVLTVTGANGCTSTANAEVELDNEVPGAQAAGGTLSCTVESVQLQGTGNGSFSWSGPNGFTSNDQNPTVSTAGTYVLTVTGTNGCTSTAQAEVDQDDEVPGAQATGGTLTCTTLSVQLTGVGNGSFSWSGPNGYTSNDQNPVVSEAGTYVLTVTGANGCTSTAQAEVDQDDEVPGAQATGGTLTCTTLSVQLTGVGNGSFSWSGPNGFTSNDQNPTVSAAGTYVLTVTGTNGCTSTAQAEVDQDDEVPGAQATGGTLTCTTLSVQLTGVGNGSFSWSGPNGFTSNAQNPVVSEAGTYVLTVTGVNGCTSTANAEVSADVDQPQALASAGQIDCATGTAQLSGSSDQAGVSFAWSGPGGFASTLQSPLVNAAGLYTLTVTAANGCSATDEVLVELPQPLTVELDTQCPACGGGSGAIISVVTGGSGNYSYVWSNGATTASLNAVTNGTYSVVVNDAAGCSGSAVAVLACAEALQIQLAATPVNCDVPCSGTASVQVIGGQAPYIVLWSTGATGTTVDGLCEGEYTVTVFDANQCEASGTVTIGKEDCGNECPPIIIDPIFTELTVECGADVSPGALTYPVLRKDKDCPEVVLFTWTDNWSGTCPRILTRVWTFSDTEGNTEQLTQVITVVDTQGPTILNVPADVTVECGEVPQKDDGVWAEDACKSDLMVHITDAVEEGKDKCSYTIIRTYWAMDECGNLGTATQHITVTDHTAPVLTCELEAEVKASCKDIPEPAKCTAWDNCLGELGVDVVDEWVTTKDGKCFIHRTYTAMDACGNNASVDQTIWLVGDCCGYADQGKAMEVSVVPNPSRDICTLSFKAVTEGRAVLSLYDVQGRPMRVLFDGMVTVGQEVRVRQEVSALDPGVYPYQLLLNGQMVHGRLMVQ